MNKIIISFSIGIFIGLFLAGLFWQKRYLALYDQYQKRGQTITLIVRYAGVNFAK